MLTLSPFSQISLGLLKTFAVKSNPLTVKLYFKLNCPKGCGGSPALAFASTLMGDEPGIQIVPPPMPRLKGPDSPTFFLGSPNPPLPSLLLLSPLSLLPSLLPPLSTLTPLD